MRKRTCNIAMFLLIGLMVLPSMALAESGFFEQRYRGWLWFEEKEALSGLKAGASTASRAEANEEITVEEAKGEVESIIKELEDLRYVYLAWPNFRTQKAYRDKLGEIMDRGIRMQQLWDEQNFIEPEYRDLVNSPENVFAVKLNRKIKAQAEKEIIKQFAKDYELVFFYRKSCPRSSEFEPVLKSFGDTYQIKIEAVSVDGSESKYFPRSSTISQKMIEKLGISATPTVIAIRKDARKAFELIRGFVTLSELEENTVKAWHIIEEKGINVGVGR
jgi:DNA polymerase I-like protein with 3'-5' exonuclease and polymerase domains